MNSSPEPGVAGGRRRPFRNLALLVAVGVVVAAAVLAAVWWWPIGALVGGVVVVAVAVGGVVGWRRTGDRPRRAAPTVDLTVVPDPPAGGVWPGLAELEATGPLGAIEIAAAAEAELRLLAERLRQFETAADRIEVRARVPETLGSWPAARQRSVTERAALAMEEPLAELATLAGELRSRCLAVDSLVAGAHAELTRVQRADVELSELAFLVTELSVRVRRPAQVLAIVHRRFAELATVHSTLRPAARTIARISDECTSIVDLVVAWPRGPLAAPTSSIAFAPRRPAPGTDTTLAE